jgi:hypothetical protein
VEISTAEKKTHRAEDIPVDRPALTTAAVGYTPESGMMLAGKERTQALVGLARVLKI